MALKIELQERIAILYSKGRDNLGPSEHKYFKLPVEQRQKKGIESKTLWIIMVEAIFQNEVNLDRSK